MAKTSKNGEHKYLSISTSQDLTPLLNIVTSKLGAKGYVIFSELYRLTLGGEYGYYVEATDITINEILRRCTGVGLKFEDVENTLSKMLNIGVLDKNQYEKNQIYTNKELQLLHIEAGTRRLENYIFANHFLLKKEDLEQIKKKKICIKRKEKYVFSDKKVSKSSEFEEKNEQKPVKSDINVNINENKCNIYEDNCNINDSECYISSRAKLNYTKLNKNKQNETKQNENLFSNGNGKSNSKSNIESVSLPLYDFKLNDLTKSLLRNQLITTDELTVKLINSLIIEMEEPYCDNEQLIKRAEWSVLCSIKNNPDPIKNHYAYIKTGLSEQLNQSLCSSEKGEDQLLKSSLWEDTEDEED